MLLFQVTCERRFHRNYFKIILSEDINMTLCVCVKTGLQLVFQRPQSSPGLCDIQEVYLSRLKSLSSAQCLKFTDTLLDQSLL